MKNLQKAAIAVSAVTASLFITHSILKKMVEEEMYFNYLSSGRYRTHNFN